MRVEQVFITPLISDGAYGAEVDVSEFVKIDGLSKIKRSIDSTDYSIGVYTVDDLKLNCENALGTFNENDSRSIFPFTRDKAKVRVVAQKIDPITFAIVTQTQFTGLINDEATRQNITNDTISFAVLSNDSIFRTTLVQPGVITPGTSVQAAIMSILSQPDITNLLTISLANINPDLNYLIDKPEELYNLEVKAALDLLMSSSNSALLIENDTVFVQERAKPLLAESSALVLRGRGEISNNANIISISSYNSGKQRQFNSIRMNDGAVVIEDTDSVDTYGLRQTSFSFPMVEDIDTLTAIGENIYNEFRYPKIELRLRVPTEVSEGSDLLDLVRVDAPWLKKPKDGDFLPIYGVAKYGDTITPYPIILGSVQILRNLKFKIISIEDDPKSFITTLKLRQYGVMLNDGTFTT